MNPGETRSPYTFAGLVSAGALIAILLITVDVARHPESLKHSGQMLLVADFGLLIAWAIAGTWAWRERRTKAAVALRTGTQAGVVLGVIAAANHLAELFAPAGTKTTQFVLGAGPILLMIATFAVAGSVARERTRSLPAALLAGVWSAGAALTLLLPFAFACNLTFEGLAEWRLQEAFAASGVADPGASLVRNSLEAASEHLVRMPTIALLLSLMGGIASLWIEGRSRATKIASAWLTPAALVVGCAVLWHAGSLQRAARPPFVMAGILLAAAALSSIHPVWSALRHGRLRV